MSTESAESVEEMIEAKLGEIERWGGIIWKSVVALLVGVAGITTWVATMEYRQRQNEDKTSEFKQTQDATAARLASIEIWKARSESFDAPRIIDAVRESLAAQDKRLQRVEDKADSMAASLKRIEDTLDRQHWRQPQAGGDPAK